MDNELLYWIWLAERLGPANKYTPELVEKFGGAFEIYRADAELLTGFDKDGNDGFAKLEDKDLTDATAILKRCEKLDITVIEGYRNLRRCFTVSVKCRDLTTCFAWA